MEAGGQQTGLHCLWQRRRLHPGGDGAGGKQWDSGRFCGWSRRDSGAVQRCRCDRARVLGDPGIYVFLNVVLSQFEAQSEAVSFPLDQLMTSTSDHPPTKFSHFRATRRPIPVPRHSGLGTTQLGTALCPEPRNSSQVCVSMHHGQESTEGLHALPGHSPCVGLAQGSSREAQRSCHCESPPRRMGQTSASAPSQGQGQGPLNHHTCLYHPEAELDGAGS